MFKKIMRPLGLLFLLLAVAVIIISVAGQHAAFVQPEYHQSLLLTAFVILLTATFIAMSFSLATTPARWRAPVRPKGALTGEEPELPVAQASIDVMTLKAALQQRHGYRWKRKLPGCW